MFSAETLCKKLVLERKKYYMRKKYKKKQMKPHTLYVDWQLKSQYSQVRKDV